MSILLQNPCWGMWSNIWWYLILFPSSSIYEVLKRRFKNISITSEKISQNITMFFKAILLSPTQSLQIYIPQIIWGVNSLNYSTSNLTDFPTEFLFLFLFNRLFLLNGGIVTQRKTFLLVWLRLLKPHTINIWTAFLQRMRTVDFFSQQLH